MYKELLYPDENTGDGLGEECKDGCGKDERDGEISCEYEIQEIDPEPTTQTTRERSGDGHPIFQQS